MNAPWHMNSSLRDVPDAVNARLDDYLTSSAEEFGHINPAVDTAIDILRGFILNGGKRVRPTFAWAGEPGSATQTQTRNSPPPAPCSPLSAP